MATSQNESLAMQYEYAKQSQSTINMSEEARKKIRVDRLKRQTLGQDQTLATSIGNPQASEWDKLTSLKHLEMLRETKKHTLLEKVLKESVAFKQTLDVTMGTVHLVHFLVSNPFPEDEVFTLHIQGDEANELLLIHNEGQQEW